MQRRSEMPYTCAVMEEIFRFRTLAPFGVFHCTTEEAALEKYVIPKGTTVICMHNYSVRRYSYFISLEHCYPNLKLNKPDFELKSAFVSLILTKRSQICI